LLQVWLPELQQHSDEFPHGPPGPKQPPHVPVMALHWLPQHCVAALHMAPSSPQPPLDEEEDEDEDELLVPPVLEDDELVEVLLLDDEEAPPVLLELELLLPVLSPLEDPPLLLEQLCASTRHHAAAPTNANTGLPIIARLLHAHAPPWSIETWVGSGLAQNDEMTRPMVGSRLGLGFPGHFTMAYGL
jgi:hypothetical protein